MDNNKPTTPNPLNLDELWKKVEELNITPEELAKAVENVRQEKSTHEQIEKLRAELKKQADVTPPTKP